jgi:4-hydroxyphenylpyruvate dioxygenase-like putative hemolysin
LGSGFFVPIVDDVGPNHLNTIDHISQSMPCDEQMLSWQQFYTGIFHLQRSPQLEIADSRARAKPSNSEPW